jgi:hypothetical protein
MSAEINHSILGDIDPGFHHGKGAARYYGVREVIKRGHRIGYAGELMEHVGNLEALIGLVRGSKYTIAVDLTDEKEYRAFYHACAQGHWLDIELYRVPYAELRHCEDEGRVEIAEAERLMAEYRARNAVNQN